MSEPPPEPWLRGPLSGALASVDPVLAPVVYALLQAAEDIPRHSSGLTDQQVWERPFGLAPLGFQLRHIAGSLDRLTTYLEDRQLTADQLAFLRAEMEAGEMKLPGLVDAILRQIERTARVIGGLPADQLRQPRTVGRKALPTTVIGLAIHMAEHTQRHVGQAIAACNLLKALHGR